MRFELTTPTLARLCSTPELRPRHRMAAEATRRFMHHRPGFGKWDIAAFLPPQKLAHAT